MLMAATASCFDVVHLEDTICVNCKDVKKQGSLRYYMISSWIAMVEILHILHRLWVTLFPFALIWWNVMLYATCAKYYSWNRSRLRLQMAERCFYADIVQESCSFSEPSNAEERENSPSSPHQRGSCADASHAENREISVLRACAEAVYVDKNDVGSPSHEQRKSHQRNHGFGDFVDPFRRQSRLCMLDRYGNVTAACLEESGPHHLNLFEEVVSCETTSLSSKSQARAASLHTSKLSSLCFLEGRRPRPTGLLKGCHLAACSFLVPHQVPPLSMLNVHCCPQIPLEYSCLQVNLHRNLDFKAPMCIDHVSINWSMLIEWLQTFNGGCGKILACNVTKFLTNRTRNDNYAILQFILSTNEGFNVFNTVSLYDDAMESVKLRLGEQMYLWGLSGSKMKSNAAYVDNEESGSASSEDIGSVWCTSIKSDDGMYCTGAESTIDRDAGVQDSGVVTYDGKDCDGGDGCCCYNCYRSGIDSVEVTEDVHGSFVHPVMDKGNGFYGSACCDVGYDGPHCVTDVDGICGIDYDATDGDCNNFDGDVEDSGAVCGDFHLVYEDEVHENPSEIKQVCVALKSKTWWDEGAVLVDKQESAEDSIEQEWQVV